MPHFYISILRPSIQAETYVHTVFIKRPRGKHLYITMGGNIFLIVQILWALLLFNEIYPMTLCDNPDVNLCEQCQFRRKYVYAS